MCHRTAGGSALLVTLTDWRGNCGLLHHPVRNEAFVPEVHEYLDSVMAAEAHCFGHVLSEPAKKKSI